MTVVVERAMADAHAILATSQAILKLLQDEVSILQLAKDHFVIESIDLLPDPVPVPRVTLFLFNIHENPFLKNRHPLVTPTAPLHGEITPAPLVLDLDYMLCVWAKTTSEEHLLLGDIARVLYEHPELDSAELGAVSTGAAWAAGESVQLSLLNPSIEEQARIWTTFGFKRFKLSLYYQARTVPIASLQKTPAHLVCERQVTGKIKPRPAEKPLPPVPGPCEEKHG